MRIQFVRTGGFTGMRLASTIDSDTLPAEEVQTLKNELENAHFFELPQQLTAQGGGADQFQYEITVEEGRKKHTVTAGESALTGQMQPLVKHLEQLARANRRP